MSAKVEIPIGRKFGELTVLSRAPNPPSTGGAFVFVRCDCGTESRCTLRALLNGQSRCNRKSHFDRSVVESGEQLIGQRFGALVVVASTPIRAVAPSGSRAAQVLVHCDCGASRYVRIAHLKNGSTKSCNGEAHREIAPAKKWQIHGKRGTYAIEAIGTGLVKIGASRDIKKRLWKLQPMSPVEMRLIAMSPDDVEARLHLVLAAHKSHGEWFHLSDEVRAAIGEHLAAADLSVMEEFKRSVRGKRLGKRCQCKRCGELGHYAKTCSRPIAQEEA